MDKSIIAPARLDSCRSCHWIEAVAGAGFECHRYPPVPTVLAVPEQNPMTQQIGLRVSTVSARPQVKLDDYCGEYRRAQNPAP